MAALDEPNRIDQIVPARSSDRGAHNHFRHPGNRRNDTSGQDFPVREKIGNKVRGFGREVRSGRQNPGRGAQHGQGLFQTNRDCPGPPGKRFCGNIPNPGMSGHPVVQIGKTQERSFRRFLDPRFERFSWNDRPAFNDNRPGGRKGKVTGTKRQTCQKKKEESRQNETALSLPCFSGNRILCGRRVLSRR